MSKLTFQKQERLCSQKVIGEMFSSGESFLIYPLKVVFVSKDLTQSFSAQAAFSVSKRNFKRAVMRNILKRRMREAYRQNKNKFHEDLTIKNLNVALMFIYVGKEILDYWVIEKSMITSLRKILEINSKKDIVSAG